MFRSLSVLGTVFIISFIALVSLLGLKAYKIYKGGEPNSFVNQDDKTNFIEKIMRKVTGKEDTYTYQEDNLKSNSDLNEDKLEKDLESAFNDNDDGENETYGQKDGSTNTSLTKGKKDVVSETTKNGRNNEINSTYEKNSTNREFAIAASKKVSSNEKYKLKRVKYKTSAGGSFLVVAGSFSLRSNALTRKQDLEYLGFDASEIIKFKDSILESVIAGRFTSAVQAKQLVKDLKTSFGIESYFVKI